MIGKTNAIGGVSEPVPKIRTVSGSVISISNALAMPAVSLIADIDAVQNLNGYDKPWVGGAGVNLINVPNPLTFTRMIEIPLGRTIPSDTKIYIYRGSFSYTEEPSVGVKHPYVAFRDAVTPANCGGANIVSSVAESSGTCTGDFDTIRIFSNGNSAANSTGVEVTITDLVIGLKEASAYSPYENLCPISGWSNVNVYREAQYDAGATPYATINMNGTRYGGSLDVVSGVLTVDMASIDLGSLSWTYYTAQQIPMFYADISDGKAYPSGSSVKAYCSDYKVESTCMSASNFSSLGYFHAAFNASTRSRVLISDSRYTDENTFKTAMSGVQFVYELATPQTVQLSPTTVQMLLGNNTLWADSGDSELQYWARR